MTLVLPKVTGEGVSTEKQDRVHEHPPTPTSNCQHPCYALPSLNVHPPPSHVPILGNGIVGADHKIEVF